MWRIPHNSHQLLNSQPRSHAAAWTLTTSCSSSADFTRWRFPPARGLSSRASGTLACGAWAATWGQGCEIHASWCLPGASLVTCEFSASLSSSSMPTCPVHRYRSTLLLHGFFFHGTKCVCIILYIATSMEIVPRVLYQYSIIPLIPIVIRTYTQSIPKPQPQLHHRHTRTEAELAWPKGSSKHHLALQSIPTVSTKQHPFCVIGWRAFQRMARLAVHQQQACENSEGMESVGVERNLRVPQNIQNHCFARWNWLGDLGDLGVPKASSGKMMKNAWVICWCLSLPRLGPTKIAPCAVNCCRISTAHQRTHGIFVSIKGCVRLPLCKRIHHLSMAQVLFL